MTMNQRNAVVGVFNNRDQAERAVDDLRRAGFGDDQIGFAVRQGEGTTTEGDTGTRTTEHETGKSAATGAVGGGVLGGIIGAAAALLIPGFGPVLAGGILAATLGGAAVGAATGGLVGALTGLGVPKEEAHYYQGEFEAGRTIVTVKADGRSQEAVDILRRDGAYDASTRGSTTSGTGYETGTTGSSASTGYGPTGTSSTGYGPTGTSGTGYNTTSGSTGYSTSGSTAGDFRDSGRWEDVAPRYRSGWEQRYGQSGGRWEDYEPGYQFGWERSNDPQYRGRNWNEVEPDLRRDWETRHRDKPWDRFADSVRNTWENVTGDQDSNTSRRDNYDSGYRNP